eukprot:1896741-Rhodomonas_salina.1
MALLGLLSLRMSQRPREAAAPQTARRRCWTAPKSAGSTSPARLSPTTKRCVEVFMSVSPQRVLASGLDRRTGPGVWPSLSGAVCRRVEV